MTRLVVVEARRLLPIVVLFVMLVAVSLYDGLISPSVPAAAQPNPVPYKTLVDSAQTGAVQAKVVTDLDMWVAMHDALGIPLTDYDFKPDQEVAVFLVNCQLRSTKMADGLVELEVASRKHTFQLVTFAKVNGDELEFSLINTGKDK